MQRNLGLLALIGLLLLSSGPSLADDGFYVVGLGAGVGTKISSLPYTITDSGFYYVTRNLVAPAGQDGITIKADNVTLDLMGFKISGPEWNNTGILLLGRRADVEIRNGTLINWSAGILSDPGPLPNNDIRVINVRVQAYGKGVWLLGYSLMVKGCQARNTIHSFYVSSGTVTGCTVHGDQNSNLGIEVGDGVVTGNYVYNVKSGNDKTGISGNYGVVSGNAVTDCYLGIKGSGTISHNAVLYCFKGINSYGGSLIGNSIHSFTVGSIGIDLSSTTYPNLLTQNTVSGCTTPFKTGSQSVNVANTNAGF